MIKAVMLALFATTIASPALAQAADETGRSEAPSVEQQAPISPPASPVLVQAAPPAGRGGGWRDRGWDGNDRGAGGERGGDDGDGNQVMHQFRGFGDRAGSRRDVEAPNQQPSTPIVSAPQTPQALGRSVESQVRRPGEDAVRAPEPWFGDRGRAATGANDQSLARPFDRPAVRAFDRPADHRVLAFGQSPRLAQREHDDRGQGGRMLHEAHERYDRDRGFDPDRDGDRGWRGRVDSDQRRQDPPQWQFGHDRARARDRHDDADWQDRGGSNWRRDWRRDQRFDWQRYRSWNRDLFYGRRYTAPYGWRYGYRRFSIGLALSNVLFNQRYWIDDPYVYRLPPAYGAYRWVRYYDDVLLVDVRTGQVVDAIYGFFG